MVKKAKSDIKLRTERSIRAIKNDNRTVLLRRQIGGQYIFNLGMAALCRLWQKSLPYLRGIGF